eukprot:GILJ01012603.1.p1 GENE.GILJ01012603.1~~GILJ01012603.1.p1  ORF type:complete len:279 (+),score=29.46 GILJ01012603.1:47-838(+)
MLGATFSNLNDNMRLAKMVALGVAGLASIAIGLTLYRKQKAKKYVRTFKAVLFDLDGTLVESKEIWYELLGAARIRYNRERIPYDAWESTFGQSMEKNHELFFEHITLQELSAFCDDNYAEYIHMLSVLEGASETLSSLHQAYGGNVVCVTNCPRKITEMILEKSGFNKIFPHVVCAADIVSHPEMHGDIRRLLPKPHPDTIVHACRLLGVNPTDCVFVGDTSNDILAAQAAGCYSVGVRVQGGDKVIESIGELPAALDVQRR